MRPLGFTLVATFLVLDGTSVLAQAPGVAPGQPVVPAAAPAANLDAHLGGWERKMADITNFRVEIALTRTDNVFKKEKKYTGVVLCMKPNYAILRLDYAADPSKSDYEAVICNGKSLFVYNGLEKTMTEHKIANQANPKAGVDNLMVDFLSGLKAKDAKDRFDISLMNEDANYVYLDIKPRVEKDKLEFQQLRLALFGPKTPFPYLPCKVIKVNPNGDTETWDFSKHQLNLQGIDESTFKYVKVPGFTERQAPMNAQPMRPGNQVLPGANNLPPGPGQVRQ
jgi:TIGR03009 family protein